MAIHFTCQAGFEDMDEMRRRLVSMKIFAQEVQFSPLLKQVPMPSTDV